MGRCWSLPAYHSAEESATGRRSTGPSNSSNPLSLRTCTRPEAGSIVAMRIQRFSTNCFKRGARVHNSGQTFRRRLDHEEHANRLVDFDHLPGQSGSQVAGVAIHYAHQARHVVRKFRAAAVAIVIDEGESSIPD